MDMVYCRRALDRAHTDKGNPHYLAPVIWIVTGIKKYVCGRSQKVDNFVPVSRAFILKILSQSVDNFLSHSICTRG